MPRPASFADRLDALMLPVAAALAAGLLLLAALSSGREREGLPAAALARAERHAAAVALGIAALQPDLARTTAGEAPVDRSRGAEGRMADPAGHLALLSPDGRLLRPGAPPSLVGPLAGGLATGPASGERAAVAVAAIPGSAWRVVVELPLAPLLEEGRSAARLVEIAAVALAGLLAAAALALGFLQRRRRAALRAEAAAAAARAAAEQRREAQRLFAGLPAAIYQGELFPDLTLRLEFLSDAAEEVLGRPATALMRPNAWDALPDDEGSAAVREFRRRLLDRGEALVEFPARRRDGGRTWLREHARVTGVGPSGQAAIAGVIQDISAERELRDHAAMASKLATLGTMATSIAHELTQPLSAILLAGEAALQALPPGEGGQAGRAQRRITGLLDQASRARGLVDHLRAFGRADTGPLEEVDLRLAVDGALMLVGPLLDAAGIALALDLPDDLPMVRGRQLLAEQVVVNLLVNARDALLRQPEETRRVSLSARFLPGGDLVRVTVQDSGPGFAPGAAERLFEPYFTTKAAGAGTGLGLAICRSILRSFGGEIAAEDTGRGARFTLDLPAAAAAAPVPTTAEAQGA
jgi:C4-dicarboxylate-specific signal transduction histidine kinase